MTDSFSDALCLPRAMASRLHRQTLILDDVAGWCASCFAVIVSAVIAFPAPRVLAGGWIYVVKTQSKLKSLLSCSNDVLFRTRPIPRPGKYRHVYFLDGSRCLLGSQIICEHQIVAWEIYHREAREATKQEDRRLWEAASRPLRF